MRKGLLLWRCREILLQTIKALIDQFHGILTPMLQRFSVLIRSISRTSVQTHLASPISACSFYIFMKKKNNPVVESTGG